MKIFAEILFWIIYFGGLIGCFILGIRFGYSNQKPRIKMNGDVCLNGEHNFVKDGSPSDTYVCTKCHFIKSHEIN